MDKELSDEILLEQYDTVRSEMRARSQQIATLDQIYFATIVAVLGFAFANPDRDWGLFLLVPYLSFVFYMYGQGFYHNMSLLKRYLNEELLPALKEASGSKLDLDFDSFVERHYAPWNRPRFQLVEWGLFVAPPVIALWQGIEYEDGTPAWIAWGFGVVFTVLVATIGVVTAWKLPLHAMIPVRLRRIISR